VISTATSSSASASDAAGSTSDASSSSAGEETSKATREPLKQPHSPTASSSSSSVSQLDYTATVADADSNDVVEEDPETVGSTGTTAEKDKKHSYSSQGTCHASATDNPSHHNKKALQGLMQLHNRESVCEQLEGGE